MNSRLRLRSTCISQNSIVSAGERGPCTPFRPNLWLIDSLTTQIYSIVLNLKTANKVYIQKLGIKLHLDYFK